MPLSTHFAEDILESYAMGQLSETQSRGIEEHLLICHSCQDRLERTDDFIRAFRMAATIGRQPAPARIQIAAGRAPRHWLWGGGWRPLPVGAAMVMAALAVAVLAPRQTGGQAESIVTMAAMRGSDLIVSAPAGHRLRLNLDAAALTQPSYRVELADARGRVVWQSSSAQPVVEGARIQAAVARPVPAGLYWVRLYDPVSGQLAREYGLRVQ